MLRRNGCVDCERFWPNIVQLARERKTTLAVLDISSGQLPVDSRELPYPNDIRIVYGRASPEYIWYMETPVVLELHQGIVYHVFGKNDFQSMTRAF